METFVRLRDDLSEQIRYDSAGYPIYIRETRFEQPQCFAIPNHWHDDLELIAVHSGQMLYYVNGESIPLTAGEGIIVNARQIHYNFATGDAPCPFSCILLHPMLLCATAAYEHEMVQPVLNGPPWFKLAANDPWGQSILEEIRRISTANATAAAPLRTLSSFAAIWAALYDHVMRDPPAQTAPGNELTIVRNMLAFIQSHYAERITLAQIAAAGAIGQSKCCKLFQRYLRQTPNAYLTQFRLSKSVELLRSDLSITEIAYATGFGSSSYYAETFRRYMGQPPSAYRAALSVEPPVI